MLPFEIDILKLEQKLQRYDNLDMLSDNEEIEELEINSNETVVVNSQTLELETQKTELTDDESSNSELIMDNKNMIDKKQFDNIILKLEQKLQRYDNLDMLSDNEEIEELEINSNETVVVNSQTLELETQKTELTDDESSNSELIMDNKNMIDKKQFDNILKYVFDLLDTMQWDKKSHLEQFSNNLITFICNELGIKDFEFNYLNRRDKLVEEYNCKIKCYNCGNCYGSGHQYPQSKWVNMEDDNYTFGWNSGGISYSFDFTQNYDDDDENNMRSDNGITEEEDCLRRNGTLWIDDDDEENGFCGQCGDDFTNQYNEGSLVKHQRAIHSQENGIQCCICCDFISKLSEKMKDIGDSNEYTMTYHKSTGKFKITSDGTQGDVDNLVGNGWEMLGFNRDETITGASYMEGTNIAKTQRHYKYSFTEDELKYGESFFGHTGYLEHCYECGHRYDEGETLKENEDDAENCCSDIKKFRTYFNEDSETNENMEFYEIDKNKYVCEECTNVSTNVDYLYDEEGKFDNQQIGKHLKINGKIVLIHEIHPCIDKQFYIMKRGAIFDIMKLDYCKKQLHDKIKFIMLANEIDVSKKTIKTQNLTKGFQNIIIEHSLQNNKKNVLNYVKDLYNHIKQFTNEINDLELCKTRGIKGYSKLRKKELIEILKNY
jgi:hypothetical protein